MKSLVLGLSAFEIFFYGLWSAALMLVLSQTVTFLAAPAEETSGASQPGSPNGSQPGSPNGSRRKKSAEEKLAAKTSKARQRPVEPESPRQVGMEAGNDDHFETTSLGSDDDDGGGGGGDFNEDSASSSAQNADVLQVAMTGADANGDGNPKVSVARTKLAVPLRGRSQSSYNSIDIPVTMVARRKGSADEISPDSLGSGGTFRPGALTVNGSSSALNALGTATVSQGSGEKDLSEPIEIDPKLILKKGRLFKLSLRKSLTGGKDPQWKPRDFVLSGFYLSYLDSMKRRNEFDIRGCLLETMLAHKCGGLTVDLHAMSISSTGSNRRLVLGASSEAYRDEWVQCIEEHLLKINRLEDQLDGFMEEAHYKGVPTPLEQLLLNPAPLGRRKRTDTASEAINLVAQAEIERMRASSGSGARGDDSPQFKQGAK